MVRTLTWLLVGLAAVILVQSPAEACWWRRHCSCNGSASSAGVANVGGVAGVQTATTFQAMTAMPMVVASPWAIQTVGVAGYQGTNQIPSSEVAEVKTEMAGVQSEIQSLRSEFLKVFKDVLLGVISDRLGTRDPRPETPTCGCGSGGGGQGRGRTDVPELGGPFGARAADAAGSDKIDKLITKIDELIDVLKREHGGADGEKPAEKCDACKNCEKCAKPDDGAAMANQPTSDEVTGRHRTTGRLASHRSTVDREVSQLDRQLTAIRRNNEQLRQRLERLLQD